MKRIIVLLVTVLLSFSSIAQEPTPKALNKKWEAIAHFYKKSKPAPTQCQNGPDSLIKILPTDPWFSTMSPIAQKFRIKRIEKYRDICKKKPSQNKYIKGWVKRALQ
jgi:hypothetical protein